MEITENYGKIDDVEFYECITKHNEYIKINDEEYNNREATQKIDSINTNEKMGISSINFNLKEQNAYLIHKFTFQVNIHNGIEYKPRLIRHDKCTVFIDNYANTYNFYKPGFDVYKPGALFDKPIQKIERNCPGIFYNLSKSYNETEKLPNKIVDIIKKFKIVQELSMDYLDEHNGCIFEPHEFDAIKLFKDNYEYLKKETYEYTEQYGKINYDIIKDHFNEVLESEKKS